jgi:hypothetical protein
VYEHTFLITTMIESDKLSRLKDRDGNGGPIFDSLRGIPPLEDGDGEETFPAGI